MALMDNLLDQLIARKKPASAPIVYILLILAQSIKII
jgi:hypothetical protein